MANVINSGAVSQNLSSYPVVVRNLVEDDLRSSGGLSYVTTGSSTITPSSDNASADFACGASDRAFVAGTFRVKTGKSYLIGARFSSLTGNTPTRDMIWSNASSPSLGDVSITVNANGAWTSYFQASQQQNLTFRIGFGATNQDEDANARSCTISEIFAYELDSFPQVGDPIPGPCELIDEMPGGNAYAGGFNYTYVSSGLMTEGNGTISFNNEKERFKVGYFLSDSFGNTIIEWPNKLIELEKGMLLFGHATTGQALYEAISSSVHTDLMDMDSFTYTGTAKPEFIIIQSSVNDSNEARTSQEMLDSMETIIDAAISRGLACIVTNTTPYGENMSAAEGQQIAEYNYRLPGLCFAKGAIHIDVYAAMADSGVPTRFSSSYFDSSDQTHPVSPAGHERFAKLIYEQGIKKLRGGVEYGPAV